MWHWPPYPPGCTFILYQFFSHWQLCLQCLRACWMSFCIASFRIYNINPMVYLPEGGNDSGAGAITSSNHSCHQLLSLVVQIWDLSPIDHPNLNNWEFVATPI